MFDGHTLVDKTVMIRGFEVGFCCRHFSYMFDVISSNMDSTVWSRDTNKVTVLCQSKLNGSPAKKCIFFAEQSS